MTRAVSVGEKVWAHTGSEQAFELGVVERIDGHKSTIAVKIGKNVHDIKEADVHKVNAAAQDGLPDNTYLRELNEATLLHNIRTRYNNPKDEGGCYSVTGHILIAVNPFRSLNCYEESNVRSRLAATTACRTHPPQQLRTRQSCTAQFFHHEQRAARSHATLSAHVLVQPSSCSVAETQRVPSSTYTPHLAPALSHVLPAVRLVRRRAA